MNKSVPINEKLGYRKQRGTLIAVRRLIERHLAAGHNNWKLDGLPNKANTSANVFADSAYLAQPEIEVTQRKSSGVPETPQPSLAAI